MNLARRIVLRPDGVSGYVLESSASLINPNWTPVPGVVNNSVTIPIGAGNSFFRLKTP